MGTNPTEFVIKPLADYIDINKTELRLVVKITMGWQEVHSGQQCPSFHRQTVYHQDQRNAGNRTVRHSSIQCLHQDLIELYGTGQEIVLNQSSVLERHCRTHE